MAVLVSGTVRFFVDLYERIVGDLGPVQARHTIDYSKTVESGTGADQADLVWSDTRTVTGVDDLDLRGVLASALNAGINFVKITGIVIRNKTTTAGYLLTVGNDAAGAFVGLFFDVGARIKVQPDGMLAWYAPRVADVLTTTAVTADVLQIDSGANTVTYEIMIIGRTA